ncbi:RCC1 domain-containing protein, partial [Paenibacillus sinensis]|uniref:RCC1 domain-containing protein n=1 Tax=Paenibacillus sinensis TaxID=2834413 RepID=UPI003898F614
MDTTAPKVIADLSGVISIAAGTSHSLALKSDGSVWAWGYNGGGQLGDDSTTQRSMPVQVTGLTEVKDIAGGGSHSLALKSDGSVWAWGYNGGGQLGDGTTV